MTHLAVRQHDWQRSFQTIAASEYGTATLSKVLHHVDRVLLAATRQCWSLPRAVAGLPVVRLATVGARSGERRTIPLIGVQDGNNIVVLASNWGRSHHPAWLYNLRAKPEAMVDFDGLSRVHYATEVLPGPEYDRLWRKAVSIYSGFDTYRERGGARQIPIVVLCPAEEISLDAL
jgi:deazaflavin-dependent oxidoreductase (nitroreductase family)